MTVPRIGLTIVLLAAVAPIASAQTAAAPPERSRSTVAQRIREGIQSGQLTRGEVARLRARIAAQRASGMAMRRSGATLSRAERLRIARGWREINRQIFRFRHNAMRRGR